MAADLGPAMKRVAILGSTGSIGTTALQVLRRHPGRFSVTALTAFSNAELLGRQVAEFGPAFTGLVEEQPGRANPWQCGERCLVEAASRPDVDVVLNAIVGAAGLDATLAALEHGKRVALANKESLVTAGHIVLDAARRGGGEIVPVDSEHSAILQCLGGRSPSEIRKLVVTASGGPFREWPPDRLRTATVSDALKHPTWQMGRKITIDSATLANKALEVIEAHFLFGIPYDRIEVVVHPQSIVHSFVEFIDGSVLAQLGIPSMELPILYALTHPERVADEGIPRLDPVRMSQLTFEPVRGREFPMLELGIRAGIRGGAAPAVYNAANERAVSLFLDGQIAFGDIASVVEEAIESLAAIAGDTRSDIKNADAMARRLVDNRFECSRS
ncbi:MAG TPA: 1-deoxy-D-xylulose-5-phosphate reductoisomerase [Gemmatimonadaceae bacterium]|nr:1-deoxy-D-xylulose-5-phosphate reductoisomerase [Gemmatimonadaceae bacterium]